MKPIYAYHITDISNIKSIYINDLVPDIGKNSRLVHEHYFSTYFTTYNCIKTWINRLHLENNKIVILKFLCSNYHQRYDAANDYFTRDTILPPDLLVEGENVMSLLDYYMQNKEIIEIELKNSIMNDIKILLNRLNQVKTISLMSEFDWDYNGTDPDIVKIIDLLKRIRSLDNKNEYRDIVEEIIYKTLKKLIGSDLEINKKSEIYNYLNIIFEDCMSETPLISIICLNYATQIISINMFYRQLDRYDRIKKKYSDENVIWHFDGLDLKMIKNSFKEESIINLLNETTLLQQKGKRYLPHELKTRLNAVLTYRGGNSIDYVCRKYHISRISLYRWNKAYNGNKESLMDKSHKPLSKHPNAHTDEEITWIKNLIRRNPDITLCELWYKLRVNRGYSRHIESLYRVLRRIDFYKKINIKNTSKYVPKKYYTPENIGEKWQIDVKFVPVVCHSNKIPSDKRFYQYTCIDEASRERFLYWYDEHTPANTVDFVKRCICYYNYKPVEIQTDNGMEFTWNQEKMKTLHPLDNLCLKLAINHHKIRPRTPRHNGKVERSHRNDNERFYNALKLDSLTDLREKGKKYLKRSNQIPMAVLGYKTPLEKRQQLLFSLTNNYNTFISLVNAI